MMRPKTKRNIQRVAPFGIIWLLSGWVFVIVELAASGNFNELPTTAIKMDAQIFFWSSIAITSVGLLTGFIELKYLHHALRYKSFAVRFFYKLLTYSFLFFLIVLLTFPIAASLELDTSILDGKVWEKYFDYFISITHLSTGLQLATSLVLSLFYSEISEFIGQSALISFFTGKYHNPVEEERIFMFLDMKSSTAIAEKLGHLAYFSLLREYYNCFTNPIVEYEGAIYQYVGDEIILSWEFHGDERDNRSIDCFFAMKERLQERAAWFSDKFGLTPTFKAGIHYGKVTTGEVGTIKKEILFSGDVLNVTARMQGLCNHYNTDLIVSAELLKQLKQPTDYDAQFLGVAELRGKQEKQELYMVERALRA